MSYTPAVIMEYVFETIVTRVLIMSSTIVNTVTSNSTLESMGNVINQNSSHLVAPST